MQNCYALQFNSTLNLNYFLTLLLQQVPQSQEEWKAVANDFYTLWNFPNCIGALDGKRVLIQSPSNSGSWYYDYKQQYSIVLLALVDAHARFLYVDVGANGRQSDAGVYANSNLCNALMQNSLNIPTRDCLPGTTTYAPYLVVSDDAFPMTTYMLKPYPERLYDDVQSRIFNYRLSRARRIVENAFGILVNRWRVLRGRMTLVPATVEKVVLATCALHNYILAHTKPSSVYINAESVEIEEAEMVNVTADANGDSWLPVGQQGNRGHSTDAKIVRDCYRDYFNGVGQVPWQWKMIK